MHSPKISALILIALLGSPIHAAAEPTPARASQVVAAPTATATDTERALELKVLEKSLEMEQKLLEAHKDAVAGQQKNIDWWVSFIGIFMAVVALLGGVIPYIFYRRESESLKEKQNELAKLQQEVGEQLKLAKDLCTQAEQYSKQAEQYSSKAAKHTEEAAKCTEEIVEMKKTVVGNPSNKAEQHSSEIINIRQTEEQHADDIGKMKNVTPGNSDTESDADNKAGIRAANELKENREIPLIKQLRAKALVLSDTADIQANATAYEKALTAWESVLLEKENDAQANLHAAYYHHQLAKLSEDTQKVHALTKAGEYYSRTLTIKPDAYQAANNWGTVLNEEAQILANDGHLYDALKKWKLAGERYQQALSIKQNLSVAAYNWGVALNEEAKALDNSGRLQDALEKWKLAGKSYQHALDIKPDFYDAANNWGVVLNEEAIALSNSAPLQNALEKWKLAGERYKQALDIKHNFYDAAYNWGIALDREARALYNSDRLQDALEKWALAGEYYQLTLTIKPDFHKAALNWGATLAAEAQVLAHIGLTQEAHDKRKQALDLLSDFIQKHPEHTALLSYNLACVYVLNKQTEQAIQALETCRQGSCLPDKAHIEADNGLDPIRNSKAFQAWFQQAFPESTPN